MERAEKIAQLRAMVEEDERKGKLLEGELASCEARYHELTDILRLCIQRLDRVESNIFPIYNELISMRRYFNHISESIDETKDILSRFLVAHQYQQILYGGIKANLIHYMEAMREVMGARAYLDANRGFLSAKLCIEELDRLVSVGCSALAAHLDECLGTSTLSLPISGEIFNGGQEIEIEPLISGRRVQEYIQNSAQMVAILQQCKQVDPYPIYVEKRMKVLEYGGKRIFELYSQQIQKMNMKKVYVSRSHPFLTLEYCIRMVARFEMRLAEQILGDVRVLSRVMETTLEGLIESGQGVVKVCKHADSIFGFLPLFDIYECLSVHVEDYVRLSSQDTVVGVFIEELKQRLLKTLEKVANRVETGNIDGQHGGASHLTKMPAKCTVDAATSSTMNFYKQLMAYRGALDGILGDGVKGYVLNAMKRLLDHLAVKSRSGRADAYHGSVYMINNYSYIQQFEDEALKTLLGKPFKKEIAKQLALEEEAWGMLWKQGAEKLEGVLGLELEGEGKLAKEKKNTITSALKTFNKRMEGLLDHNRGVSLFSEEVAERLRLRASREVVPLYSRVEQKLKNIHFSTNPNQFLKYSSGALSTLIRDTVQSASMA